MGWWGWGTIVPGPSGWCSMLCWMWTSPCWDGWLVVKGDWGLPVSRWQWVFSSPWCTVPLCWWLAAQVIGSVGTNLHEGGTAYPKVLFPLLTVLCRPDYTLLNVAAHLPDSEALVYGLQGVPQKATKECRAGSTSWGGFFLGLQLWCTMLLGMVGLVHELEEACQD